MEHQHINLEEDMEFIRQLYTDVGRSNKDTLSKMMRGDLDVKRGLRNADGTGVMVGYTQVGSVIGYSILDGERIPMEGQLSYSGYNVTDLIEGYQQEGRFGFEEVAYLLLLRKLPNAAVLVRFNNFLFDNMPLPNNFKVEMILNHRTSDVMNH